MTSLSVYGWSQGVGGTHWYRIAEPLRGLTLRGHYTNTGPTLDPYVIENHQIILTHMLHEESGSQAWQKIARYGTNKLVIDVDDDVWNFDSRTDTSRFWTDERLLRLQNNIACAHLVTTPNERLAEILSELNPNVAVLRNYVPDWLTREPRRMQESRKFTIGYQGARQHSVDLQTIGHDLWRVLGWSRTRLRIYGELNPLGLPPGKVVRVPWNADVPTYYRSLQMTVGIGPLVDIPFNYAKSNIRAVEYAALGIPAILTDVPEYRRVVIEGVTGMLVPMNSPSGWYEHLEWAYRHPEEMRTMGKHARMASPQLTTEFNSYRWEDAYRG